MRGESINISILLRSLFKTFKSNSLFESYLKEYLFSVQPDFILTFIDNNRYFYILKYLYPQSVNIAIQNGLRDMIFFDHLTNLSTKNKVSSNLSSDYLVVFGHAIATKYQENITSKVIPLGSFKNNSCCLEKSKNPKGSLVFISQYRKPNNNEKSVILETNEKKILWKDFYAAEFKVLPWLADYCYKKDISLLILSCSNSLGLLAEEYNFYRNILHTKPWEFVPKAINDVCGSYKTIVEKAEFVLFIDSALGYETLARGIKGAAFSIRGEFIGRVDRNFGWPANLPNKGLFWTNHSDENEFEEILNHLTAVSDEEWKHIIQKYLPKLMEYDPGNSKFLQLMRNLGVPLKN